MAAAAGAVAISAAVVTLAEATSVVATGRAPFAVSSSLDSAVQGGDFGGGAMDCT